MTAAVPPPLGFASDDNDCEEVSASDSACSARGSNEEQNMTVEACASLVERQEKALEWVERKTANADLQAGDAAFDASVLKRDNRDVFSMVPYAPQRLISLSRGRLKSYQIFVKRPIT